MTHTLRRLIAAFTLTIAAVIAVNAQVTVPNTLVAGTTIRAADLNTNFSTIGNHALDRLSGGNISGNVTLDVGITLDGIDLSATLCTTCAPTFKDLVLATPATGLTVGGNVIVGTTGKIPALTSTYFTSLAFAASNLTGDIPVGITQNSVAIANAGKQSLWVPASALSPTITSGATGFITTEMTAGRPNINGMSFINGATTNAQFTIAFPKSWNAGTVTYQAFWTGSVAGAGTSIWGLQCVASADNATLDAAFGTAVEVTDTFLTLKFSHVASESGAVTISGAAADTLTTCQVYRKGASDTRAQPSILIGIKFFFTTNAKNDA